MMGQLPVFFVRFRLSIIMGVLFLGLVGLATMDKLPISLFPKSTKPTLKLTVFYDYDLLTFKDTLGEKIERSLLNLEKVERVEGLYNVKSATYTIFFDWEKVANLAVNEVTAIASFYQTQLPQHLPDIKVDYVDEGIENYMVVSSDRLAAPELSRRLNEQLSPALNELPGIRKFMISEVAKDEVIVKVDPLALVQERLSFDAVLQTLKNAQFDTSLGSIQGQQADVQHIYLVNRVDSLQDIRDLVIYADADHNRIVTIGDIADVGLQTSEQGRVHYIGNQQVVAIAAWPKPDTDIYQFSQRFQTLIHESIKGLGSAYKLNNPMDYVNESLKQVVIAVLLGMLFASLTVLVAFKSFRLTSIIFLIIPLSLLPSMILVQTLGVGLNLVSLGAMSIAIGLVVDNAIVVIDAIVAALKRNAANSDFEHEATIIQGVGEIKATVIASSLTSIVVFLPLAFTQPIVESLVGELVTVVVAFLMMSIFISLLFIPALVISICRVVKDYQWLFSSKVKKPGLLGRGYRYLALFLMRSHIAKLVLCGGLIYAMYGAWDLVQNEVKWEVSAEPNPNIVDITVSFSDDSYSQAYRESLVLPLRDMVEQRLGDKVNYLFTDLRQTFAFISLYIKDYKDAPFIIGQLRSWLPENEGYSLDVSPWVSAKLQVPSIADLKIYTVAKNEEASRQGHNALQQQLKKDTEVFRLKSYPSANVQNQIEIYPMQSVAQAQMVGLNFTEHAAHIIDYVRYGTGPRTLYKGQFPDGEMEVRLQINEKPVAEVNALANMPVMLEEQLLQLRHVLDFSAQQRWAQHYSRNGSKVYMSEVWLGDNLSKSKLGAIENQLDKLSQGKDWHYVVVGSGEEIQANIESLFMALIVAFFLVLICLLALTASFRATLVILIAIPFGLMGAGYGLYSFESTVSINSLVGVLLLIGLTINNKILIVEKFRRLLKQNQGIFDAELVVQACVSRAKAATVTTMTTCLSLLPLALGLGSNGEIMQPLGVVICVGLLVSSVIVFLLTPIMLGIIKR